MKIKKLIKFIYTFFIIGFESLGNLSAVTTVLEENLIKKNKYITEEDLIDAVTFARIGPGAITANAVAFLGNKIAGFWGGFVATICYTIAPLIIITCIYGYIEDLIKYQFVASFLKGSLACICVLFIKATYSMGKNILNNKLNTGIFIFSLLVSIFLNISGILIIIFTIIFGIIRSLVYTKKAFPTS